MGSIIRTLPRSEISALIDEWILSERNRAILKRRLLDGVTYENLADEFYLSDRHIKTIVSKNIELLESHIERPQAHKNFTQYA